MKIYILIFFILFASIVVILKLITSPATITSPKTPHDIKRYETGNSTSQNKNESYYRRSANGKIDDRKLIAFAKAFVEVQSYMNRAGSHASYKETSKIVQSHGLSVEDYTKIASRMNENSDFQGKAQDMISEAN